MDSEEKREAQRKDHGSNPSETYHITPLKPLTHEAYGGGMYGMDDDPAADGQAEQQQQRAGHKPLASETQSADGPVGPYKPPKQEPPPSAGDRDVDITGQSYIQ